MIWTQQPDWAGLGLYMLGALVVMYLGYGWFMATKRGFADVL
jgi:lipopolysaccharide transport system permease protein